MRTLMLAAAVLLSSVAVDAAENCMSVATAKANVESLGGVNLGMTGGPVDLIGGPSDLADAADVLIVIDRDGVAWRIPVDAAGCVSLNAHEIEQIRKIEG